MPSTSCGLDASDAIYVTTSTGVAPVEWVDPVVPNNDVSQATINTL
jgi:hypothetical protein